MEKASLEEQRKNIREMHQQQQDSLKILKTLESRLCNVRLGDESTLHSSEPPSRTSTNEVNPIQVMAIAPTSSTGNAQVKSNNAAMDLLAADTSETSDSDASTDEEGEPLTAEDLAKCTSHIQKLLRRVTKLQNAMENRQGVQKHRKRRIQKMYTRFCHKFETDIISTPSRPPLATMTSSTNGKPPKTAARQPRFDCKTCSTQFEDSGEFWKHVPRCHSERNPARTQPEEFLAQRIPDDDEMVRSGESENTAEQHVMPSDVPWSPLLPLPATSPAVGAVNQEAGRPEFFEAPRLKPLCEAASTERSDIEGRPRYPEHEHERRKESVPPAEAVVEVDRRDLSQEMEKSHRDAVLDKSLRVEGLRRKEDYMKPRISYYRPVRHLSAEQVANAPPMQMLRSTAKTSKSGEVRLRLPALVAKNAGKAESSSGSAVLYPTDSSHPTQKSERLDRYRALISYQIRLKLLEVEEKKRLALASHKRDTPGETDQFLQGGGAIETRPHSENLLVDGKVDSETRFDELPANQKPRKGTEQMQKCANCHIRKTPEWRRGLSGNRDLCNSCRLRWAKQVCELGLLAILQL